MSSHLLTGRSITRVEDERLLRGRGRYVDDVRVPGTLTQVHAGGTWIESTSRSTIRVINPATEKQIAAVTEGSAEDAERAVAAVQVGVGFVEDQERCVSAQKPRQREPLTLSNG